MVDDELGDNFVPMPKSNPWLHQFHSDLETQRELKPEFGVTFNENGVLRRISGTQT